MGLKERERTVVSFGCGWFGKLGAPLGHHEVAEDAVLGGSHSKEDLPSVHQHIPRKVSIPGVYSIALGGDHSVALGADGTYVWGRCPLGPGKGLGTDCGKQAEFVPTPIVIEPEMQLERVACGRQFNLGVDALGGLHFWGLATASSTGTTEDGNALTSHLPRIVPLRPKIEVRELVCGWRHALFTDQNGKVWSWGEDEFGQCGLGGDTNVVLEPREVPGLDCRIKAVACGGVHSGAVNHDGQVFLWGNGGNGRLGMGDSMHRWRPMKLSNSSFNAGPPGVALQQEGPPVTGLAMGANFTVFVVGADGLFASGNNAYGQIGCHPASNCDRLCPEPVHMPETMEDRDMTILQVACGAYHTLCLLADGMGVLCWGQSSRI